MSSTNRGTTRNDRDLYKTPLSAFDRMLPLLPDDVQFWEPACGDGQRPTRLHRGRRGLQRVRLVLLGSPGQRLLLARASDAIPQTQLVCGALPGVAELNLQERIT